MIAVCISRMGADMDQVLRIGNPRLSHEEMSQKWHEVIWTKVQNGMDRAEAVAVIGDKESWIFHQREMAWKQKRKALGLVASGKLSFVHQLYLK